MKSATVVVGAGGFIGSALVRALDARGDRVVAVAREDADDPAASANAIARYAALLEDARALVWLACTTTPASSAGEPMRELDGNLRPLLAFLQDWSTRPDVPLVFVSTGGAMYGDVAGGMASEADASVAKSYYAAGKIAAEHFIAACCRQHGGSATILRPSNVYGRGQAVRAGFGIVPAAFHALAHDTPFVVWGDGGTVRDYLAIDDFIALCLRAIDAPTGGGSRVYNASSAQGTSVAELLERIETVAGRTLRREYRPARATDVARIVLDNAAARAAFDWRPRVTLEQGLADAWRWFRDDGR